MILKTTNSPDCQCFDIPKCKVEWIKLSNLIKNKDDSEFPALKQIEVWGWITSL